MYHMVHQIFQRLNNYQSIIYQELQKYYHTIKDELLQKISVVKSIGFLNWRWTLEAMFLVFL